MITEMTNRWQSAETDWQSEWRQAIRDPFHLLEQLELPRTVSRLAVNGHFSLRVPQSYVTRMHKGDWHDPLLRQVLPLAEEKQIIRTFKRDPVGDQQAEKIPGMLHKYQGRVLLLTTSACAIHCRYCFRQHYAYPHLNSQRLLDSIQDDTSFSEVILSGGDPLSLSDSRLAKWIDELAVIPHLRRLRIHTRLPIVLPKRITKTLLEILTTTRLQIVMVVHANHPNEIDETVCCALDKLVQCGITVLNQSVLLRGVNDTASSLVALSEKLFSCRVLPYYLHMLDRVQGATHFEVPMTEAIALIEQLRIQLPGYLVPKLVQEVAGMAYKQPLW